MSELFRFEDVEVDIKRDSCSAQTKTTNTSFVLGKRLERCSRVVGKLKKGETLHCVSAGEWSMHDLLFHILDQTGPAEVWIASWSITENPCRLLIKGISQGLITKLNILFDWRVKIRCPAAANLAKKHAASCYLTSSHAKVTVVWNEEWQIAIVGSANYTNNPRIEALVITCDPTAATFHRNWINQTIQKSDPFEMERRHERKRKG